MLNKIPHDLESAFIPEAVRQQFGHDPMIYKTKWTLAWGTGWRFYILGNKPEVRLVKLGNGRLAFQPIRDNVFSNNRPLGMLLFFVCLGLFGLTTDSALYVFGLFWLVTCGPILGLSLYSIYKTLFRAPIIDLENGYLWFGNPANNDDSTDSYKIPRRGVVLDDIHAIQLLTHETKPGRDQRLLTKIEPVHRTYQLNVVMKTGKRHQVLSQGYYFNVRKEFVRFAQTIAEPLDVPVWNGMKR